jgi:hypothetical protein
MELSYVEIECYLLSLIKILITVGKLVCLSTNKVLEKELDKQSKLKVQLFQRINKSLVNAYIFHTDFNKT